MTGTTTPTPENTGPLKGVRILDLSRVLAAPFCMQIMVIWAPM